MNLKLDSLSDWFIPMRKQHLSTLSMHAALWLGAITLLVACRPSSDLPAGLDTLSANFQSANQAETIEPMLALYCLEGCDELTISRLRGALRFELGLPIQSVNFEPLTGAPEETIEFTYNGVAYGPSLEPRYRMRVVYAVEDHFTSLFTVGQHRSGEWQIICAKPKPPLRY
jgi:hypothetical protein